MTASFIEDRSPRYVDVLLSLKCARDYNQVLGRIQLQKSIYLADTLSILLNVLAPKMGHETYKNGPWDFGIQNTVDVLAFRGFVVVTKVRFSDGGVHAGYSLSNVGDELLKSCVKESYFAKKQHLYQEIARQVNKRGWLKLKSLTYQEPNYLAASSEGWGRRIEQTGILENISARILVDFNLMMTEGRTLSLKSLVSIFFRLLD